MQTRYETLMNNIIASQLSDAHIQAILEKEIESAHIFKNTTFHTYFSLNLQKLFDDGLWFTNAENELIDFSLKHTYIRSINNCGKYLTDRWEKWFKSEPVLQQFVEHLKSVFPDAKVQGPTCYWYESSGCLELKFEVEISLAE